METLSEQLTWGDLVLFQPLNNTLIRLEDLNCFQEWFEFIREWEGNFVNNRRAVWTKWFGVPLHS